MALLGSAVLDELFATAMRAIGDLRLSVGKGFAHLICWGPDRHQDVYAATVRPEPGWDDYDALHGLRTPAFEGTVKAVEVASRLNQILGEGLAFSDRPALQEHMADTLYQEAGIECSWVVERLEPAKGARAAVLRRLLDLPERDAGAAAYSLWLASQPRMEAVLELVEEVFPDLGVATSWLAQPIMAFNWRAPDQLLVSGKALQLTLLEAVLGLMRDGNLS